MARIYITKHPHDEPSYGRAKVGSRVTIPWNTTTKHRRKFIKRNGQYLKKGVLKVGEIYFWGEYEPQTECTIVNVCAYKAIHDTLYSVRRTKVPSKALNTDPYVFGDHFKHICCGMGDGKTRRKFKPDDVVLFGRIEEDVFTHSYYLVLDTVFVVKEEVRINYSLNSTQYYKASIEPMSKKYPVFYRGENYVSGKPYYSYVPCRLDYTPRCKPRLDLASLGFKVNKRGHEPVAKAITFTHNIWNMIQNSVINQGWLIGTHIDKI